MQPDEAAEEYGRDAARPASAVARLLRAEEEWQRRRVAAQAEAERILSDAGRSAEASERELERELGPVLAEKRAEREAALAASIAATHERSRLARHRLEDVPAERVETIARAIASRVLGGARVLGAAAAPTGAGGGA